MLVIRPVTKNDHKELLALAREAGIGMTSLPADADVLERKIARAIGSFEGHKDRTGDEAFLFVLEDTEKKRLAGTTGIVSHVGMKSPFYSYKLSTIVQASPDVGVYSAQKVLHMVNDYTGASELGSLFLHPDYRAGGNGRFLSRSRYLMLAEFPQFFSDVIISEIRGVQDEEGGSPFYKNLAQHFFQMEFKRADFINATRGGQFISDLMPKYPIYVNLLSPKAQEVIGKPFHGSLPAVQLLEAENFRYQGYLDVFDAGPTMQAERKAIRSVRKSKKTKLVTIDDKEIKPNTIIATTMLSSMRMTMAGVEETPEGITLTKQTAKLLQAKVGDELRYIEL
jgi:arginine N-succinyltransferase